MPMPTLDEAKRKAEEQRAKDAIERRVYASELRVEAREGSAPLIVGHAAVFNQEVDIGGWFFERVAPGAFARAIREDDVRSLFNHDPNFVLGRNKAGTLKLREDEKGLMTETIPPDTQVARDLAVSIGRGDISQMSFGFRVMKEQWEERGKDFVRTLLEVMLYDISPVTFPAYPTTDVGLRSLEQYRDSRAGGLTTRTPGLIVREKIQRTREKGL